MKPNSASKSKDKPGMNGAPQASTEGSKGKVKSKNLKGKPNKGVIKTSLWLSLASGPPFLVGLIG